MRAPRGLKRYDPHAKPKGKTRSRFKVISVADIKFDPSADAGGLVDGLLPTTGVAQLYGRWKSFPSFVAVDLGWAVAKRSPTWAGHAIKRCGAVVYVACEGQASPACTSASPPTSSGTAIRRCRCST